MLFFYLIYIFFLISLVYFLLNLLISLKIYIDTLIDLKTIELLQKLDSLILQKSEHFQKINELQDQLAIILINVQKKTLLDSSLDFIYNNSSFFVGISFFFISLVIINMFGKSDIEFLTEEIIKTQTIAHDSHIAITKEALTTLSDFFFKDVTKLIIDGNSISMSNCDQKLEFLSNKLTAIDKINIEVILQKINELVLKSQAIDAQISHILELLLK